jgi:predicted permease
MNDLRYALRTLGRSPGLAVVAVGSLALGIGANTAIFSVVDAVVLRSLPVSKPNELVVLRYVSKKGNIFDTFRYREYLELRGTPGVLTGLAAVSPLEVNLTTGETTARVHGQLVSGNYFPLLGLRPTAGRLLSPDDDRVPGAHSVCVIGDGLWRRQFGSATDITGKTLRVNGRTYQIVGVAPEGFDGTDQGSRAQVYIPLMMAAQVIPRPVNSELQPPFLDWGDWLQCIGRLQPEVSASRAQSVLDAHFAALPFANRDTTFEMSSRHGVPGTRSRLLVAGGRQGFDNLRFRFEQPLAVLLFLVGLLLLIACANVANLLLARAAGRHKEIAVRLALGAGRWALVRQLLAESALLAAAGTVCGALLSIWLADLLVWLASPTGVRPIDVHPDFSVALFLLGASLMTAVLFGIAPAVGTARVAVASVLKSEGGGTARRHNRLGGVLVVVQVGLSVTLLAGAGLLLRSLHNLQSLPTGFQPERVVVASLNPGANGYDKLRARNLIESLMDRAQTIPGVERTSSALISPVSGNLTLSSVAVPGYQGAPGQAPMVYTSATGPGYFSAIGSRILEGREFTRNDREGAPQVAVISREMARKFWPGRSAVGQRFRTAALDNEKDVEVVGVVQDSVYGDLREDKQAVLYVPLLQAGARNATLILRVAGDPAPVLAALRQVAREVDRDVPLYGERTLAAQIAGTLSLDRMLATVAAIFGILALALAMAGLYAVLAYTVARRSREIGIRMALGAERNQVIAMVLRDAFALIGLGLAAGIPLSLAASRWISSYLFGLKPQDPLTYGAIVAVLSVAAALAAFVPSRRASTVDPMVVLRYD